MSDLQCAATAVVLAADAPVDIDSLRAMRPVAVRTDPRSLARAGALARALALTVEQLPGEAGSPAGLTQALTDLADQYRGECMAVVVPPGTFHALRDLVLPAGEGHTGAVVEMDADGQRWATWPPDLTDARGL